MSKILTYLDSGSNSRINTVHVLPNHPRSPQREICTEKCFPLAVVACASDWKISGRYQLVILFRRTQVIASEKEEVQSYHFLSILSSKFSQGKPGTVEARWVN